MNDIHPYPASGRVAGIAMAGAALASVVAMAHHPTSADEMQGAGFLVHPLLIGLSALIFAASVFLSRRLGHGRLAVVAANTAMAIWLAANTGAATINGLIVPALAARGADIGQDIFRLCWEANQALAAIGVFAAGFAYALWATVLLRGQPWIDRGLGVVALITGLLPMLALATGLMQMNIAGATVIYTAQSLWIVLAGIWLSHEPAH